ncbi:hypothetical protein TVAG_136770 [Trichomonas vaginalis G3]|uniref:Uncharacterized protein n=1 Tax=Trichomonas vaginalis (strain ATCC PRA-98 / G3) TaxID=412133 RepID=A2DJF9_TRIV3|nr:hypothetical protein TVAGG3_0543060 [Trichomonas vaginalis G3]EAY19546.1 hypothetical protein TVAG_136770 [Trichomonas vaginalis G3]KAI5519972.1 hypothetical protein TVAGG3_0543060 [Trichomonas vaginalis G3]|eukprot:XP_001580532.1 hypothetical protein [Trichomonas vaginalis G3]
MSDEQGIIDTINLAIKTQEEMKAQLLSEIAKLEQQNNSPSKTEATIKFYRSSIEHLEIEKQSLNEKIHQMKQVEYPTLQQKLQRITQKNQSVEARIKSLKKVRHEEILKKMDKPERAKKHVLKYIEKVKKEIQDLTKDGDNLNKKIVESKDQLQRLQQANLTTQRQAAHTSWASEISDEALHNSTTSARPRKRPLRSLQARNSAYLPPDPTRFSPYF